MTTLIFSTLFLIKPGTVGLLVVPVFKNDACQMLMRPFPFSDILLSNIIYMRIWFILVNWSEIVLVIYFWYRLAKVEFD